ncbi:hypothetical protein [Archangium sp.]|uniref:hypothetical protein n=1 Tax=Archangium sp. TaxID=1872627 RepID=UPI002D3E185D|nr:hypothetical protein [Archangium sp.]HYO57096.1 hypothetical protein [Archangium sp.]
MLDASMQGTHAGHTATLLRASGEVLVTDYTATELPSGLVLFAGGSCPRGLLSWPRRKGLRSSRGGEPRAAVAHRPTPPPLPLSRT